MAFIEDLYAKDEERKKNEDYERTFTNAEKYNQIVDDIQRIIHGMLANVEHKRPDKYILSDICGEKYVTWRLGSWHSYGECFHEYGPEYTSTLDFIFYLASNGVIYRRSATVEEEPHYSKHKPIELCHVSRCDDDEFSRTKHERINCKSFIPLVLIYDAIIKLAEEGFGVTLESINDDNE